MKPRTPGVLAGIIVPMLFFSPLLTAQVITVANGNWNTASIWSSGVVPGPGDDVIVRHDVTISNSSFNVTVNNLTIENGVLDADATVSFNNGTAARDLHILNNLTVTATASYDCRFQAQGANTHITIDGDIILNRNHTGFVEVFGIRLRYGSTMTANNMTITYTNSGDDNQEVYVRETSSLVLSGDAWLECTGGNEEISLDIVDDAYFECNNLTGLLAGGEAPSGIGRDIELRIWDNAQAVIHGNLTLTRTGGRRIEITLGDGSPATASLLVEGNMALQHLNGLDHTNKYLSINAIDQTSLTVRGNVSAISNSERELEFVFTGNSTLDIDGDVFLQGSANDNLTMSAYGTSRFFFGGDIIMDFPTLPNPNLFYFSSVSPNITTVTFDGTANQTVPGAETYGNLVIDNPDHVTLSGNITVNNQLTLANGKMLAPGLQVTLPTGAGITGSSSAYICNGILRRGLDTGGPYWFYVGDTVKGYSPVRLSALSVASTFAVKYYPYNPDMDSYPVNTKAPTLDVVSNLEYWMIDRVSGSGTAQVTLGWNAYSGVNDTAIDDLLIAHWDGSQWTNTGPCVSSGSAAGGLLTTVSAVPGFSPFTLASTGTMNLLKGGVILNATPGHNKILLQWTAPAEIMTAGYYLERSGDGQDWETITWLTAAQVAAGRYYDEQPLECKSYYRLKWTTTDHVVKYAGTVAVTRYSAGSLQVFPNPVVANSGQGIRVRIPSCYPGKVLLQIHDITGRLRYKRQFLPEGKMLSISPAGAGLGKGLYFFRVQFADNTISTQVLIE